MIIPITSSTRASLVSRRFQSNHRVRNASINRVDCFMTTRTSDYAKHTITTLLKKPLGQDPKQRATIYLTTDRVGRPAFTDGCENHTLPPGSGARVPQQKCPRWSDHGANDPNRPLNWE